MDCYVVISKYYDDGRVSISEPIRTNNAENKVKYKAMFDLYVDVFNSKEDADKFYKKQLDELRDTEVKNNETYSCK